MSEHLSTLMLHRLRYGELELQEAHEARSHLDACPHCAARLRLQEQQRAAFVLEPVPAAIRATAARPAPWRRTWVWFAPLAAALAAVLFFVIPRGPQTTSTSSERLKGSIAGLEVVAERDGRFVILAPGSIVIPGDRIQMRFDPGSYPVASLAGRDGSGVVEVYGIIEVAPGSLQPAPFALELDDTPGDQEFFAIFTHDPPDPLWLADAIEGDVAPEDAVITSIRLRKEVPR